MTFAKDIFRWLSVMTPNKNRYELLGRLIEEDKVDGVVEMTLQACILQCGAKSMKSL